MKYIFLLLLLALPVQAATSKLYDYKLADKSGKKIELSKYKGSSVLFVNIATQCGYTSQLSGLEALYKKYKSKGLVVVGIPSNDFGGQTPESDKEVAKFCSLNYGVTFPLSKKLVVKGKKKDALITYFLTKSDNNEIGWNFEKFLFDKKGKFVKRFRSSEKPLKSDLEKAVASSLK